MAQDLSLIRIEDLTDRAIRLYIENGLVSPSCSENYAGRKNIEFSEEDIEALKNIIDDTVCAIMLEPIQGEGGINLADVSDVGQLHIVYKR